MTGSEDLREEETLDGDTSTANGEHFEGDEKESASLPRINVTDEDLPAVSAQAWAALCAANAERPQFVRVGNMPCVRTPDGLEALTPATLTFWLGRVAVFIRELKNRDKVVKPPTWLVADMLAQRVPDLPEEVQQ